MELDYGFNVRPFSARELQGQGLTLDSQRNLLDFYKNSLNRNQERLDSRYVDGGEVDNQGFRIGFHGFHLNREENSSLGDSHFHDGLVAAAAAQAQAQAQPLLPPQKKRSYLFASVEDEYAPGEKMGESYQYEHQELIRQQLPASGTSRLGVRNSGGEIVEVQGGHIVRSTGRKDRHSKVCTAKGPRDRRVRLAAHTAIEFYDVQDRLGYDRPSKAVDWLIKKAKSAIDELAELPAWKPTSTAAAAAATNSTSNLNFEQSPDRKSTNHHESSRFGQHPNDDIVDNQMGNNQDSSFLPPSLHSDSIADTIKSFFPMGTASAPPDSNSSAMQFHQSFSPPEMLSRSSNQSQDLRLSLQSFKDPIHQQQHHQQTDEGNNMFLDGSGWPERMVGWGGGGNGDTVSGGYVFSPTPSQTPPFFQTLFSQTTNNHLFNNNSQRGPLQSSNTPSIRAWIDQPPFVGAAIAHPSSMSGFTSGVGGYFIPARIYGEQEEHDGISDTPSSGSSDSRH